MRKKRNIEYGIFNGRACVLCGGYVKEKMHYIICNAFFLIICVSLNLLIAK